MHVRNAMVLGFRSGHSKSAGIAVSVHHDWLSRRSNTSELYFAALSRPDGALDLFACRKRLP